MKADSDDSLCLSADPPPNYQHHLFLTEHIAAAAGVEVANPETVCEEIGAQAHRTLRDSVEALCGRESYGPFAPVDDVDPNPDYVCAVCKRLGQAALPDDNPLVEETYEQ